ncbi:DUF2065 family protein [Pseudaeromonas sp. ZJS20]|uniref:DUF2065 family protein n=1 Tax=Pseudaeromonas aegiceratis TaxID=3153928 RepID=UPI00390C7F53
MHDLTLFLGLWLLLEGVLPLCFPRAWLSGLRELAQLVPGKARRIGGVMVAIGAVLVLTWLHQG